MTEETIKAVSRSQMESLEKAISSSSFTEFAKKALIWMLEKSENLTKQISLSFPPAHSRLGRQVAFGIHNVCGSGGHSIRINDLMKRIGTPMFFSSHGGHYVGDRFNARTGGFTAWLAIRAYSDEAEKLPLNIDEIKAMKIP